MGYQNVTNLILVGVKQNFKILVGLVMKNKFGKLTVVVILLVLLLAGAAIYFSPGTNKERPIGLVFVKGLTMEQKMQILNRAGLTTPEVNLPYC